MKVDSITTGLQLQSLVTDGMLELRLVSKPVRAPGPNEVVVRIEAAPINPSDLGILLGAADVSTVKVAGVGYDAVVTATIPSKFMGAMSGRLNQSMPVGNEGAGTVVAAGASDSAQALLGKMVAVIGGAMYAQFRILDVAACFPLPSGATAADGASSFINPLTALGMVETMKAEAHKALVHTAAASNLGQMLNRICIADGIKLINIVRSSAQEKALREQGAEYVCNSTTPGFTADLEAALIATGATIAFDAIGGGLLAGQILVGMEIAANKAATVYSRYGSTTYKQVYIYGGLDTGPTLLQRSFGMAWGVGGWLLAPFLEKIGQEKSLALRQRVAAELKTTFASHYSQEISLIDTLKPAMMAAYSRRATGEKFLVNPSIDL